MGRTDAVSAGLKTAHARLPMSNALKTG